MTHPQHHLLSNPNRVSKPRYLGETVWPFTGENYGWHAHEFGQLISAASGSMYVGTPGRVLLLSPAVILWIPPNVQHWMRYGANNEMRYVDVNQAESKEIDADCRIMTMTPLMGALIASTRPDKSPGRTTSHNNALHDLLRYELATAQEVPLSLAMPEDDRILGVAEAALANPGLVTSVNSWLASAPASRKTIERLFTTETGMSPSMWLRYARVLHAISKLAAGEKVSSVAFDMGYKSSSAFSYMFRRILGRSPSDFCR